MYGRKAIPLLATPLVAQKISLVDVVKDAEEEEFLTATLTIFPVFELDVEKLLH